TGSTLSVGQLPGGNGNNGATGILFSLGQLTPQTNAMSLAVSGIAGSAANSGDSVAFNGVNMNNFVGLTLTNNLALPGTLNLGDITNSGTTAASVLTVSGSGLTILGDVTNGTNSATTAL